MSHQPAVIVPVGSRGGGGGGAPPPTSLQRSPGEWHFEQPGKGQKGKKGSRVTPPRQRSPPPGEKPQFVKIKDPAVKGNVLYDVPVTMIVHTQGLREYLDTGTRDDGKRHTHRACICKLWMEGRCGQGAKCKSFHVDPPLVDTMRKERGVEFDTSFVSELIVKHASGDVFAVRYTAACKTRGLEAYKTQAAKGIEPAALCVDFNLPSGGVGTCPADRNCAFIHIKPHELKEYADGKQKTPCCAVHGDTSAKTFERPGSFVTIQNEAGLLPIPVGRIATTAGCSRINPATPVTPEILCAIHVRSRCKFGRSCTKLHICRDFAKDNSLVPATPSTPPFNVSPTARGIVPIHKLDRQNDDLPQCGSSLPPLMEDETQASPARPSATQHLQDPLYGDQPPPESFELPEWDPDTDLLRQQTAE